ncbi:MAG TPA: DoxX family protein [Terriglobales bacterium]|nr:DoxX family protein [Terriglobales bacterium]
MDSVGRSGTPISKARFWTGAVLSAIPVLMLLLSAGMKLMKVPAAVEGMPHFGYPANLLTPLGIVEAGCTLLYVIPQTSVLGAILLTGYLGGATATHVRVGEPWFIPVGLGIIVWLGLWLREPRLNPLVPIRKG